MIARCSFSVCSRAQLCSLLALVLDNTLVSAIEQLGMYTSVEIIDCTFQRIRMQYTPSVAESEAILAFGGYAYQVRLSWRTFTAGFEH